MCHPTHEGALFAQCTGILLLRCRRHEDGGVMAKDACKYLSDVSQCLRDWSDHVRTMTTVMGKRIQ